MEQGASRRWVVSACVAAVASAGLAGCTPEPVPIQTGAPVTPSATPTPTPTPTEPAVSEPTHPPEWLNGNNPGAIAAAEYFIELYNYANATGDLTEWDARSDANCDFCFNTRDRVGAAYADGGRLQGGAVTFTDGTLVGFEDQLRIHGVQFAYTATAQGEYDSGGSLIATTPDDSGYLVLEVGYTGDGWMLVSGNVVDSPYAPYEAAES